MITKRDTRIPRKPLLWLAAALLFVLPPMYDGLALWVPTLLLVAIAAKFWMEPRGYRLRFLPLKIALVVGALVAIFISYGAIKGIEPGVSLIIVLMSLKIFEAHTVREFHFMVMLGWVLCLCGFFLAQDLVIAVCLLVAFTLLTTALVQFYRGLAAGGLWPPLRGALTLLAQAVPLIVLLFLLFPRVTAGFRLLLTPNATSASGFSDRLSPGSVEAMATSTAVAFRAEFPDDDVPRSIPLYWRGLVLTQGDGMEWRFREMVRSSPQFHAEWDAVPTSAAVRIRRRTTIFRRRRLPKITAPTTRSPRLSGRPQRISSFCHHRSTFHLVHRLLPQSVRHRGWNFSARFSSDPKSLRPEVCPLSERTRTGTPALQLSSWINEDSLPFYNFFTSSFGRDAGQTALVRRRHDGDAGKRRDRSHSHY